MDSHNSILLIHWNANNLSCRLGELKVLLYTKKPHIVCVCETWYNDNYNPKFIGYSLLRKDRQMGKGGGLLMIIRNIKKKI